MLKTTLLCLACVVLVGCSSASKTNRDQAPATVSERSSAEGAGSFELDSSMKTKITNLDVVNRAVDRSTMTFGIEYEYRDSLQNPRIGLHVLRRDAPETSQYFTSSTAQISKKRGFAVLPVNFRPPDRREFDSLASDQVVVFLEDGVTGRRYNVGNSTMLLVWAAPGKWNSAASNNAQAAEKR